MKNPTLKSFQQQIDKIHRWGKKHPAVFFYLCLVIGVGVTSLVVFGLFRPEGRADDISLTPDRRQFYRDEFAEWSLRVASPAAQAKLKKLSLVSWVEKEGRLVETIGGTTKVPLTYDPKNTVWRARWPSPWNAAPGTYHIVLGTTNWPSDIPLPRQKSFQLVGRPFKPLPKGFGVLTVENIFPFNKVEGPDGQVKGEVSMVDWVDFIGADALVVQGGESSGYDAKPPKNFPWILQSEKQLRKLGAECHKRGLQFGVYLLSFMVGGPAQFSPDYTYGWTYENGRAVNGLDLRKRRGISITDPQRPQDIVALLNRWKSWPEVDILGLDYIRPVFGSYELVPAFVEAMNVSVPPGWRKKPLPDQIAWLVHNKILPPRPDMRGHPRYALTDLWFWYRAHRTAQVVRQIKKGVGDEKPLWAFTLSWEKGWHHGQDPVMMRDAGIDMDAIMLYEADSEQFRGFLQQWAQHVKKDDVNLLVGDAIDWVLHQKTLDPSGPEDFMYRNLAAAKQFHTDGPVRGIFLHDYVRARRGRIAPYSTREWLLAGGAALTTLRAWHHTLDYSLTLQVSTPVVAGEDASAMIALANSKEVGDIGLEFFTAPDVEITLNTATLNAKTRSLPFTVRWQPNARSAARGYRSFVAVRATRLSAPRERCQIYMFYFTGARS